MMKKALLIALAAVLALALTACTGTYTCDVCMKESTGRKYQGEWLGVKVNACPACYNELMEIASYLTE